MIELIKEAVVSLSLSHLLLLYFLLLVLVKSLLWRSLYDCGGNNLNLWSLWSWLGLNTLSFVLFTIINKFFGFILGWLTVKLNELLIKFSWLKSSNGSDEGESSKFVHFNKNNNYYNYKLHSIN